MTVPPASDLALERATRTPDRTSAPEPAAVPPHPLVRLQHQAGNAAVARLVQRLQDGPLRREVPEDEIELKRDQSLQRNGDEEEMELGAKHDDDRTSGAIGLEGGSLPDAAAARIDSMRGAGSTLGEGVRSAAENALGTELSAVRVHQDAASDSLARGMTAKAFTSGSDVFLRSDMNPNDASLMGHELTHVVQQSSGEPSPTGQRMSVGAADDPLEHEADDVSASIRDGVAANREIDDR